MAQPCSTPNRSLGHGVLVGESVVATAAHTVEDDLRALTVDGHSATVLAIDARTDLALVGAPIEGDAAELSTASPPTATVDDATVQVVSTGPLVVHDTTAGQRHRRQVHRFTPGVRDGTSGTPLLDTTGAVLGIVVLDRLTDDAAYAVTTAELQALLTSSDRPVLPPPGACPGSPG